MKKKLSEDMAKKMKKKKHLTLGHKDSVIGHIPNTVLNTVGTDG